MNWRDLFVVVTQAQPDTATFKAFVPDWQHTPDVELLRGIEYSTRWLVWAQTRDAQNRRNVPEPYPLPWDPKKDKGDFTADVLTRDELDRIIGWA